MTKIFSPLFVFIIFFAGCDASYFNPKPSGYNTCTIAPVIRDNNGTYISQYKYYGLDEVEIFTIEGEALVQKSIDIDDIASIANMLPQKRAGFNIENTLYHVDIVLDKSGNKVSYALSEINMLEEGRSVKIKDYIDTYFNNKMDFDRVISEVLALTDEKTSLLPISIYPDGLYIVYPSKTTVKYNRGANPGALGYKISYYRYYPVENPQQYVAVQIPCVAENY